MKILRSSALILTLSLCGSSALKAMHNQAKLSSDDQFALDQVNKKLAEAAQLLNEVRIFVKSISPKGLAALQESGALSSKKQSVCLNKKGLKALLELNKLNQEEELRAAQKEKLTAQIAGLKGQIAKHRQIAEASGSNVVSCCEIHKAAPLAKQIKQLEEEIEKLDAH